MNPWDIIGWLLLTAILSGVGWLVGRELAKVGLVEALEAFAQAVHRATPRWMTATWDRIRWGVEQAWWVIRRPVDAAARRLTP